MAEKGVSLRKGKIGYGIDTMAWKIVVIKRFLKWLYEVEYIKTPLHTASNQGPTRSLIPNSTTLPQYQFERSCACFFSSSSF
jgi:hypothetical protein